MTVTVTISAISLFTCMSYVIAETKFGEVDTNIKDKIVQFRETVHEKIYPNNSYVHQHIQDDLYIFNWLANSNFVVSQAVSQFMNNLAWRNAEKIDNIHLEDWSDFREEYPQFSDSVDKTGRPVSEYWISFWNVRRAVVSGQKKKLVRWLVHLYEITQRRLYQLRKSHNNNNNSNSSGESYAGAVQLIEASGFNVWEHYCPACLSFHVISKEIFEQNYPFLFEKTFVVNVGSFFHQISSALIGTSKEKIGSPRIYSTNKRIWMPVLDREIEKNQRSIRFGGTIIRN